MRNVLSSLVVAGTAIATGVFATGAAQASALSCSTTQVLSLGDLTSGGVSMQASSISAGACFQVKDTVFGNFNFGSGATKLPGKTNILFSLSSNDSGSVDYINLTFNYSPFPKTTTAWSYAVATSIFDITSLNESFNETKGTAVLTKNYATNIGESGSLVLGSAGTSPDVLFKKGVKYLTISDNLDNKGTTQSVENTISVFVPEPATLALFGAGFAGLGFARRRRRS